LRKAETVSADLALTTLEWLLTNQTSSASSNRSQVGLPQLVSRSDGGATPLVWHAIVEDWGTEHLMGAGSVALNVVKHFDSTLRGAHIAHVASRGAHQLSLWEISSYHLAQLQVEVYIAAQSPHISVMIFERRLRPQGDSFADRLEQKIVTALDAKFRRASVSEIPLPSSLQGP
jgi:hypothetical protein